MGTTRGGGELEELIGIRGKRALVVGGGFGIGLSVARTFSASGVQLALVEREEDRLGAACRELSAFGVHEDVTAAGVGERAVQAASDALGPLDILVNIVGRGQQIAAAEQTFEQSLDLMKVNYSHHVEFCGAFARRCMAEGRQAAMTLVSSLAGTVPFPMRSGYGAAKAALDSFVRSAAVEFGPYGIRVNAVAPGIVDTDRSAVSEEAAADYAQAIPLRRVSSQQEVANSVLFLSSELSSYMTGQTMIVDGGASLLTRMWP
ncbi:NAD(P)-dependent dehydrogenase (short-subunit alcohol dehydrogenase family) [Rhodococcus sp. 27YEA15]|uniref:SDR family NAD(P)-dependent oxidoreductase n=1 Tax=Rhodococcus sp. 27YEA15 TaxID=3156259 RepID=UPI003C7AB0AD